MISYILARLFSAETLSLAACQGLVNSRYHGLWHTARSESGIFVELTVEVTFPAQGTEAGTAETGTGSVHDGPVTK